MSASAGLLALGIAAAVGLVNARRPLRAWWGLVPSWMLAWITVELAPHLIVLSAAGGGALVAAGALDDTTGWIGLGLLAASDLAAIPLMLRARRTVVDLEGQLEELGESPPGARYPRAHVLFPFLMLRRRGVRCVRGVEYARYGRKRMKLDVYMPKAPNDGARRPAIVQIHGGAWVVGSRHEQGIPLLTHLAANGWVGFNIDYRLAPRATWPDPIVDVKRAIAWVRDHAGEYGVDPSFIAITGGSAGGHLCALAALTANDPAFQPGFERADTSVAAAVPFYGLYDLVDDDAIHAPAVFSMVLEPLLFKARRRRDPERFRAASPVFRVHSGAPPMLVIHGEHDSLVPVEEARRFARRLREESRSTVLYIEMKGAQHAFDIIPSWRTVPIVEAIARFLEAVRAEQRGAAVSPAEETVGVTS